MHVYIYFYLVCYNENIVRPLDVLQYLVTHCVTNHNEITKVRILVSEVILRKKGFIELHVYYYDDFIENFLIKEVKYYLEETKFSIEIH